MALTPLPVDPTALALALVLAKAPPLAAPDDLEVEAGLEVEPDPEALAEPDRDELEAAEVDEAGAFVAPDSRSWGDAVT